MPGPRVSVVYISQAGKQSRVYPAQPVLLAGIHYELHENRTHIEVHYKEVMVAWRDPNAPSDSSNAHK